MQNRSESFLKVSVHMTLSKGTFLFQNTVQMTKTSNYNFTETWLDGWSRSSEWISPSFVFQVSKVSGHKDLRGRKAESRWYPDPLAHQHPGKKKWEHLHFWMKAPRINQSVQAVLRFHMLSVCSWSWGGETGLEVFLCTALLLLEFARMVSGCVHSAITPLPLASILLSSSVQRAWLVLIKVAEMGVCFVWKASSLSHSPLPPSNPNVTDLFPSRNRKIKLPLKHYIDNNNYFGLLELEEGQNRFGDLWWCKCSSVNPSHKLLHVFLVMHQSQGLVCNKEKQVATQLIRGSLLLQ